MEIGLAITTMFGIAVLVLIITLIFIIIIVGYCSFYNHRAINVGKHKPEDAVYDGPPSLVI